MQNTVRYSQLSRQRFKDFGRIETEELAGIGLEFRDPSRRSSMNGSVRTRAASPERPLSEMWLLPAPPSGSFHRTPCARLWHAVAQMTVGSATLVIVAFARMLPIAC